MISVIQRVLEARVTVEGRTVGEIRPGDLVFFNTLGRSYSHMGIYLGDGRFIHAPNSRGKVRVDRMDSRYYADRFEGARTLLPEG